VVCQAVSGISCGIVSQLMVSQVAATLFEAITAILRLSSGLHSPNTTGSWKATSLELTIHGDCQPLGILNE